MGYIGATPSNNFITTDSQRVTSSTNNYVDLDNSISSLNDVIVWVNSVKQDSTNLTLTTSTRITLGGTLTASDVVEIAYLGKAVATQTPDTGTVTNDMLAGSIANSKLANSSITLNGSAVSLGGSATVGETSDVIFTATINANQSLSHEVMTKINFDTEIVDVGSCYDTTNKRFTVPSGKGGYYNIGAKVVYEASANSKQNIGWTQIYKNGSSISLSGGGDHQFAHYQNNSANGTRNIVTQTTFIVNLSASDYIEIYGQQGHDDSSSANARCDYSVFWGYKLIT